MHDLKIIILTGVGVLISTFFTELKDILKLLFSKIIFRLSKKQIDFKKHYVFKNINNHLIKNKYTTYSQNKFKQIIIIRREEIIWNLLLGNLEEIIKINIDTLTKDEFTSHIEKMINDIESYKLLLYKDGVSEKVINVMETNILSTNLFVKNLIDKVLIDDIYDTNSERMWAILTIYNEYLLHLHNESLLSLIKANGSLIGEEYKGFINDGTY
jgi:hypothetical protein